jgi:extracellular factor (EF) 3-hydroxypalmitic acid methyl ester biosynthesis protein
MMTTGVSAAKSILWRRDHLGAEISKTAGRVRNGRILSVASGHLRELDIVRSMVEQRDFEIVALDQDAESLQEAVNSNPDFNIRPVNKSISHLFKAEDDGKYDLIYSAGLFDYLPANTASGLLDRLLRMLAPSGRLLVGNYAPENYGRGYMEGIMGWSLIYRSEAEFEALLNSRRDRRVYRDEPGNVIYLEVLPHWT